QQRTTDPRVERVESAMGLIGSRWRPAIMFALIMEGTKRFSELRRLIPGVSQRMLTKQLRDLERHGLVRREFFESVPPRVEYSATELGRTLHLIYRQVCDWARAHWLLVVKARQRHARPRPTRRTCVTRRCRSLIGALTDTRRPGCRTARRTDRPSPSARRACRTRRAARRRARRSDPPSAPSRSGATRGW